MLTRLCRPFFRPAVDLLINERQVVTREVRGGYYHPSAYLLSKLTLDASKYDNAQMKHQLESWMPEMFLWAAMPVVAGTLQFMLRMLCRHSLRTSWGTPLACLPCTPHHRRSPSCHARSNRSAAARAARHLVLLHLLLPGRLPHG